MTDHTEFWQNGFVIMRNVFTAKEVSILKQSIVNSDRMRTHYQRAQELYKSGSYPSFDTIFVWNDVFDDDLFSLFTRNHKIFDFLEDAFKDEIYVYHNKVTLKYPNMPGFKFHQDYFYWYEMGNLYPDMATAFVAIDPAKPENGCLEFIKGSHKAGRMQHKLADGKSFSDSWVDDDRLSALLQRHERVYVDLDPGDVAIFHCNLLHGSAPNKSSESRLSLLGCYNTRHNDPIRRDHPHPNYAPQKKIYRNVTLEDLDKMPDFNKNFTEK